MFHFSLKWNWRGVSVWSSTAQRVKMHKDCRAWNQRGKDCFCSAVQARDSALQSVKVLQRKPSLAQSDAQIKIWNLPNLSFPAFQELHLFLLTPLLKIIITPCGARKKAHVCSECSCSMQSLSGFVTERWRSFQKCPKHSKQSHCRCRHCHTLLHRKSWVTRISSV